MGRALRIHHAGLIYHVINRGNNQQAIFLEDHDFERYLGIVYRFKKQYAFKLFAFCLMTNHVHLLIQVGENGTISKIMQSITLAHTKHHHHKYQTSGHVWQGRFKSPIVSDDEYLLEAMRYIEKNPLKAGMVAHMEDYPWSSHKLNIRLDESKLIDRHWNEAYQNLADNERERVKKYKALMQESLTADREKLLQRSISGECHYISDRFAMQLQEMLPQKRRRGRPRKKAGINT